jgi:DNA segregation ATPase FtsK/SpoIIIE-like protein
MKQEHINEIKAIIVLCLGLILFASLISFVPDDLSWYTSNPNIPAKNLIRVLGAYVAGGLFFVFGYSSYLLAIFLFFWSWNKFSNREIAFTFYKFISFLVLFCVGSSWLSLTGPQEVVERFSRAGVVGIIISDFLVQYVGVIGAHIILLMLGLMALILTGEFLITPFFIRCFERAKKMYMEWKEKQKQIKFGAKPAVGAKPVAPAVKLKPKINIGNLIKPNKAEKEKDKAELDKILKGKKK